MPTDSALDIALRARLASYAEKEADYWSFRGKAVREQTHAYVQYPAMMVPQMQGELIRTLTAMIPSIRSVFDPFVGSGTVMTEAMLQGLDFAGQDINPLSVLICRAKSGPFDQPTLCEKATSLTARLARDTDDRIEADFPGLRKWFRPDVVTELSRIRRAIRSEGDVWGRRFFWVALAETVRLTSNSRTSTFKLHVRPAEEIASRELDPIDLFEDIVAMNLERLSTHRTALEERQFLRDDHHYRGTIDIALNDSMAAASGHGDTLGLQAPEYDLLVTSPPYGDNETTVPYGQYSYLPLQWIDLGDIDVRADRSYLATTKEIDNRSLGGKRKQSRDPHATRRAVQRLSQVSPSFARTAARLADEPPDRLRRVASFCSDLDRSLDPVLAALKPDGHMIWTVGNRQVARACVPMDDILTELLTVRGVTLVSHLRRAIPSKRMAVKNKVAATMRAETILVARKGGA